MGDLSTAKTVVREHYGALDGAPPTGIESALARHCTPDCEFRFVHPFNEVRGPEAAAEVFWKPVRQAFSPLQRRQDIFMAGGDRLDGGASIWVV